VVTLVPDPGATCAGMAYRVAPATFAQLDFREKNGYLRFTTTLDFGAGASAEGLVYIATADNAAWLGPADPADIARHIASAIGPSGSNPDYVFSLARALRELGVEDPHVVAVEAGLRKLRSGG
jgi:cation transport protein ChaC